MTTKLSMDQLAKAVAGKRYKKGSWPCIHCRGVGCLSCGNTGEFTEQVFKRFYLKYCRMRQDKISEMQSKIDASIGRHPVSKNYYDLDWIIRQAARGE